MHVDVFDLLVIDLTSDRLTALVGRPPGDGIGPGQTLFHAGAGRGTGENPNLKSMTLLVQTAGMFSDGPGHGFGGAGRCKARKGNGLAVPDALSDLLSSKNRIRSKRRHFILPSLDKGSGFKVQRLQANYTFSPLPLALPKRLVNEAQ